MNERKSIIHYLDFIPFKKQILKDNLKKMIKSITERFEDKEIKSIEVEGRKLLSVKDVLSTIGYKNTRTTWKSLKPIVEEESGSTVHRDELWYPELNRFYETDFVNEEQIISILFNSKLKATLPFRRWCLKVVKTEVKKVLDYTTLTGSEQEISNALALLASRSRNNLVFEKSVESEELLGNDRYGLPRVRRYDIIQQLPKLTRIYEIKKHAITCKDVSDTINKDYLEVAATRAKGKKLDLVFVAPSLDESGLRAIERYDAQTEYRYFYVNGIEYHAKIRFISVSELAMDLYNKAAKSLPQGAIWELNSHCVKYCHSIFSNLQLQTFKKGLYGNTNPVYYMEASA